jgi:hypothetical protein
MERTVNISELIDDFEAKGIDIIENSWKFFPINEETSPEEIFQFRCTVRSRLISFAKGACLVLERRDPSVRSIRSRLHQINDNYYAKAARQYLEVVAHWVDEVDAIYSNEAEEDE